MTAVKTELVKLINFLVAAIFNLFATTLGANFLSNTTGKKILSLTALLLLFIHPDLLHNKLELLLLILFGLEIASAPIALAALPTIGRAFLLLHFLLDILFFVCNAVIT